MVFNASFNTMRGPMMDMATYGGIDSMLYSREGFQTQDEKDKEKTKKEEPKKSGVVFYIILFIILIALLVAASIYFNINLSTLFINW